MRPPRMKFVNVLLLLLFLYVIPPEKNGAMECCSFPFYDLSSIQELLMLFVTVYSGAYFYLLFDLHLQNLTSC